MTISASRPRGARPKVPARAPRLSRWGARLGALGGLVALGFALRLAWVLAVPSRPVGDFALYRESATYLLEHGALDPEFIYMPGYVFLLALVEGLGGGLLAAKMIGVAAGTAMVAAAGGIADQLFGRRAGLVAAALAALWPAGIAVTSVTGTDLPAGALVALAVLALVRLGPRRPWWAAVLCGLTFGAGAWVRAVAVPLAALSFLYWWALERRWGAALARTAVVVAIAAVALLPWGFRNRALYGEFFLTDSHGGHTALVGANPNSEGTYSRSLNVMFTKGTGYRLMDAPARHRASDRAAYALAKQWSAFEPAYALGLLAAKADRLLSHERNLLYWPIFRQGVLPASARGGFLDRHRGAIEFVADAFWWLTVALFAAGVALAVSRRDARALALLAFPAAMVAIYASFFSEVRYHLAIAPLLFPLAALALSWMMDSAGRRFHGDRRGWIALGLVVVALFASWQVLLGAGAALRRRHRWAVCVCSYPVAGQTHLCSWRERLAGGESPLRGTWDGVGVALGKDARGELLGAVRTQLPLEPGRYHLRARVASPTGGPREVALSGAAGDTVFGRVLLPGGSAAVDEGAVDTGAPSQVSAPIWIDGFFDHPGGDVNLDFNFEALGPVASPAIGSKPDTGIVWISELLVERFPTLDIIPRQ